MMDVAKRCLLSVLLIVMATSSYGEQFEYSCVVKGNVDFTSLVFSYERPVKWPGEWRMQQPVITTGAKLLIAGYGKIKSSITAIAEGPPYNFNNVSLRAMTPTYSILIFSLLEDAKSEIAWGFGKYKIWHPGQYENRNLFILCERRN